MIRLITIPRLRFSKISNSLKLLQLTPPTTKKEIKSKYMVLAKQCHPDMKVDQKAEKSKQQVARDSHKFVEITQAYKYLKQLSEEQINSDRVQQSGQREKDEGEPYYRPMSEEERNRQATYSYFNKKYRKSSEQEPHEKKPLYKAVPQLFFGIFLVFLYLVEWAHAAYQKSRQNLTPSNGDEHNITLKGMNHRRRYEKPPPLSQMD